MNSLKTMFLAVLMSAATYGVYVTITGNPPGPANNVSKAWETEPPKVEIPETVEVSAVTPDPGTAQPAGPGSPSEPLPPTNMASAATSVPAPHAAAPGQAGGAPYPDTNDSSPDDVPPADQAHDASLDSRAASTGPYGRLPSERYAPQPQGSGDRYRDAAADRYPPDPPLAQREGGPGDANVQATGDLAEEGSPAEMHAYFLAQMAEAEALLAENRLADALRKLSQRVGSQLSPDDESHLMELLDQLAGTVVYSREHLLEAAYEVQPGDTLERIAAAYQVPWQVLANINGIGDSHRPLRPGDQLKVVKGPFDAYVDLGRFQLTIFVDGCYAGRFAIGVGTERRIVAGDYEVQKKLVNPQYYGEEVINARNPDNPFGELKIELGDQLSIHGTNDPSSIGREGSRGCIRLRNEDMADLFSILTEKSAHSAGSLVKIVPWETQSAQRGVANAQGGAAPAAPAEPAQNVERGADPRRSYSNAPREANRAEPRPGQRR